MLFRSLVPNLHVFIREKATDNYKYFGRVKTTKEGDVDTVSIIHFTVPLTEQFGKEITVIPSKHEVSVLGKKKTRGRHLRAVMEFAGHGDWMQISDDDILTKIDEEKTMPNEINDKLDKVSNIAYDKMKMELSQKRDQLRAIKNDIGTAKIRVNQLTKSLDERIDSMRALCLRHNKLEDKKKVLVEKIKAET